MRTGLFILIGFFLLSCTSSKEKPNLNRNTLKISTLQDPLSLDPRIIRDLPSVSIMHLFYEGLMRCDSQGKLIPALAESVSISPDLKTYTFKIRKCFWCNGDPITATDFEQTWKSVLNPHFPAPNAYQLYNIKGAKMAKEGKASLDDVGVHATDPFTLVVELESPVPYFLEMTACHFYFPVNQVMREQPRDASINSATLLSSGPFRLDTWKHRSELTAIKNPLYWNADEVTLDHITLLVLDDRTALQMFEAGILDWTGSPLSTVPQDAVVPLSKQNRLEVASAAGTHWYRFNTKKFPFNHTKMRKAFALALNRQDIVEHVTQGNQIPAFGIVPPSFYLETPPYYIDNDITKAQSLFQEALNEMGISQEEIPSITLCYGSSDRDHRLAQAVQQQWSKALPVSIKLEKCESQVYYDKLARGDFQISSGSWFADFRDPINFLEIFKQKETPTNHTHWENQLYKELLELSSHEPDSKKRFELLAKAEAILMDEMPIAPLFFCSYNYAKKKEVHGVYFSELGFLDFTHAILKRQ